RSYGDWSSDVCSSDLLEHPRAGDAERQGAIEQLAQGLFETVALAALGEVRRFGRRQGQSLDFGGLLDRARPPLVRRRLEAREQRSEERRVGKKVRTRG